MASSDGYSARNPHWTTNIGPKGEHVLGVTDTHIQPYRELALAAFILESYCVLSYNTL